MNSYRLSILFSIILLTLSSTGEAGSLFAQEEATLSVYRSGGFRHVTDPNDEQDYTIKISPNNSWILTLSRSSRRFLGTLSKKQRKQLDQIIENAKQVDDSEKIDPRIADLPELNLSWDPKNQEPIRLRVDSSVAKDVHRYFEKLRKPSVDTTIGQFRLEPIGSANGFNPILLESIEEVSERLGPSGVKQFSKVDFSKQKVVAMRWAGSGQDRLEVRMEGHGQERELVVKYKGGRTRDLRQHCQAVVMPKSLKYRVESK